VFDFFFKAQTRNLVLLEDWLASPEATARRSRRGLLLLPLTIVLVFAILTILGVWMLFLFFSWLAGLGS
jgi:cytoskeletal protein RodZ